MHMEKIGIKDIVALATAGYKPSEVKELLSLANQSEDEPAKEGEKEKDQPEKTEQHEGGKEQPQEAQKKGTDTPEDDSVILSYKRKVEELEKQVKDLQEKNVHKDQSEVKNKDDEELLNDITLSFM